MRFFLLWALAALGYWLVLLWDTLRAKKWMFTLPLSEGNTRINPQENLTASPDPALRRAAASEAPLVSVIIAAKEEESSIADTVRHLLSQNYPRLEIIAVNDRSRDATGRKLDELRRWSESKSDITVPLRVIHITTLPQGWLGKNHALYQGYLQARGKLLLFTDADVRFHPNTVADSVRYLQEEQADHLTLSPDMPVKGIWLRAFVDYFFFTLCLFLRPWRANDDFQFKQGMGIGAFNLLTRYGYEKIGTHRAIAMRPDDDLQLGRLVKQARLRQRLASGHDHIAVEWYKSLRGAVEGLEKNLFSGFGYRTGIAVLAVLGQLGLFLFPVLGMLLPGGTASICALAVVTMAAVYLLLLRSLTGKPGWTALLLPAMTGLLCYVVVRSVWLTLKQGGIYWRGTFYSLQELRRMQEED
ncbi:MULTISPECIES: glycosyltransferase [Paenibacillus]|uniref:glycosyltransferase n=1 Tax=Paenibacillus TaxID=44249 RepID=UPI0022B90397|nr:glycosyltransferase [Paenibacillus caseinilyticus]MCZ8523536.1 glycosyltransferase [Paenibacillus caseinilyticus]